MNAMRCVGLVALALTATGCARFSSSQLANTNGQGEMQLGVEPGAMILTPGGFVAPGLDFSFRYGLSDKVDFGGRIGSSLYDIHTKIMFTDADAGAVFSLAPSASILAFGGGGAGVGYGKFDVPLLIGINTGDSQLVIGPRVTPTMFFGGGGGATAGGFVLFGGSSLGYAIALGESFHLFPEVGVGVPLVGGVTAGVNGTGASATGGLGGGAVIDFRLNLLFGL